MLKAADTKISTGRKENNSVKFFLNMKYSVEIGIFLIRVHIAKKLKKPKGE